MVSNVSIVQAHYASVPELQHKFRCVTVASRKGNPHAPDHRCRRQIQPPVACTYNRTVISQSSELFNTKCTNTCGALHYSECNRHRMIYLKLVHIFADSEVNWKIKGNGKDLSTCLSFKFWKQSDGKATSNGPAVTNWYTATSHIEIFKNKYVNDTNRRNDWGEDQWDKRLVDGNRGWIRRIVVLNGLFRL